MGHEITHVLEGTELYNQLQSAIVEYAESKGEYQRRYDALAELYKGVEDADVDAELTADLVGDYLFTDEKFVRQLCAGNRNLFQKVFDEIKYLFKAATAGSKEARMLEKVKKTFEQVYRANSQALGNLQDTKNTAQTDGVRYSLGEYTNHQKQNWANSKRIVVYDNAEQLSKFIEDSIADSAMNKKMYFGSVSSDLAGEILKNTGLNVENYNLSLGAYEIRKILKDHGNESFEALRGQRAVVPDDFAHIVDIVTNPQNVELSPNTYMGKPAIIFSGEHNGRMNVVAVVSDKRLDLFVQTAYVNTKKGNLPTPTGEQAPINTPEANNGMVSNDKISQTGAEVNAEYSRKEQQFEIIRQSNPASDEYHTWIRSAEDIKTFQETLTDPEWEGYDSFDPDYTQEMAQEAIKSGVITVYSSYPIENGVFVSPSRMEAESYSGNGKVYEQTVRLEDVAWIDPTQGQYAPVNKQYSLSHKGEVQTTQGNWHISGKDVQHLAPTREDLVPVMEDIAPVRSDIPHPVQDGEHFSEICLQMGSRQFSKRLLE